MMWIGGTVDSWDLEDQPFDVFLLEGLIYRSDQLHLAIGDAVADIVVDAVVDVRHDFVPDGLGDLLIARRQVAAVLRSCTGDSRTQEHGRHQISAQVG